MSTFMLVLGVLFLTHSPNTTAGGPGDAAKKQEIGVGKQATFANSDILFKGVASDSRCPTGTHCFWEGEAVIELEITEKGQTKTVKLSTLGKPRPGSGLPSQVQVGDQLISIISLAPHPVGGQPAPEADSYRLTLGVEK